MSDLIFDIETGPLPLEQLAEFYEPPQALPPWDESMVKYGNLKVEAKRAEKREAAMAEYAARLANETVEREAHRQQFVSKAALSPLTGRVLAIGFCNPEHTVIVGEDDESEAEILEAFWHVYRTRADGKSGRIIGFNSDGFDLPFLVRRSWFHGIAIPESAFVNSRFWSSVFVDLMAVWGRGAREFISLDTLARFFGIGNKPDGVNGGMFSALWFGNNESRQQAIEYLKNDLEMTWRLAERMGVIS